VSGQLTVAASRVVWVTSALFGLWYMARVLWRVTRRRHHDAETMDHDPSADLAAIEREQLLAWVVVFSSLAGILPAGLVRAPIWVFDFLLGAAAAALGASLMCEFRKGRMELRRTLDSTGPQADGRDEP
jgi:hypothetical protein